MSILDKASFREAMSRVGAAVHIITTRDERGAHGFTASAVCSVTDTPPTLLFCLNRNTSSHEIFTIGRAACVNTLAAAQEGLSAIFADRAQLDVRFRHGNWATSDTGAPVLADAAASFEGIVTNVVEVGSHSVVFLQVRAIRIEPDVPVLMYFSRGYHRLPALPMEING